jgi:hypothetical protein
VEGGFVAFDGVVEEIEVRGRDLLGKVGQLIRDGNVTRIVIKDTHGDTFAEFPVTLGVVGVAIMPLFTAIAGIAALVADFKIVVVRIPPKTGAAGPSAAVNVQATK